MLLWLQQVHWRSGPGFLDCQKKWWACNSMFDASARIFFSFGKWAAIYLAKSSNQLKLHMNSVPQKKSQLNLSAIIRARKIRQLKLANIQLESEYTLSFFLYQSGPHIAKTAQAAPCSRQLRDALESLENNRTCSKALAMSDQLLD